MLAKIENILKAIFEQGNKVFPCGINDAYLYGSYARNDYDDESDIDILLTVDMDYLEIAKYRSQISEIASDLSLENDVLVSVAIKPLEQFRRYSSVLPYYQNVLKEGIRYAGV